MDGYRTGKDQIPNRNGNMCGTATEHILSSVPCLVSSDWFSKLSWYLIYTYTIKGLPVCCSTK